MSNLEGLDEGPQQIADALGAVQQFDQTHDAEKSEKRDGDPRVLRVLRAKQNVSFLHHIVKRIKTNINKDYIY